MLGKKTRDRIKSLLPQSVIDQIVLVENGAKAFRAVRGRYPRECPICGYKGLFWATGHQPLIFDGRCPGCRSIARYRQHHLLITRHPDWIAQSDVLHFAPEPCLEEQYAAAIKASGHTYLRAEYHPTRGETKVDVQAMQFPDGSFDTVICHNVLEHVEDDRLALREIRRVLRPNGRALLSVPMVDAWADTYEDKAITSPEGRDLHFNQDDHLRLYGRDFIERVREAGFDVETYVAAEPEVSRYGLERGETIFIATLRG